MALPGGNDGVSDFSRSSRPKAFSYGSNSLPSTPRQHAQDMPFQASPPSPSHRRGSQSPHSTVSDVNRPVIRDPPRNGAVLSECRYMTTQTSRRRMDYASDEILGPTPEGLRTSQSLPHKDELEQSLAKLYESLLPSAPGQVRREMVLEKLRKLIENGLPDQPFKILVFGSSGNLLFTDKSDVDICVTMTGLKFTCVLADLLAKNGMRNVKCVHAKAVPIVKIWDPELDLNCDLNLNNDPALKNTQLVKTYIQLDPRVRPLGMIIKYWTKRRIINEASGGALSSYTWTLLLINFLQTRNPPILPRIRLEDSNGHELSDFSSYLETYKGFGASNQETLSDLLLNFFRRYGYEIDFETVVVSVREGKLLSKTGKGWDRANNNRLCVEEPFNTQRNLANTADGFAWRGLHMELRRAFDLIADGKDVATEVCAKFEFPPDPKPAFERPPPLPKPTLTRSLSQSGQPTTRGGRGSQNFRGNRTQGRDVNRGPISGSRRASSAAAFGHTPFPLMFAPPQFGLPVDYVLQTQQAPQATGALMHDQLAQLSRHLSAQEQQLRQRLNHTQSTVNGQLRTSMASLATGIQPLQTQAQQHASRPAPLSGYQTYDRGAIEDTPSTAPLPINGYGWPSQWTNGSLITSWNSPSRSLRGSETSPASPSLTPVHARRPLQRSQLVNPTVGTTRSHSQPARPLGPQGLNLGTGQPGYGMVPLPGGNFDGRHQQQLSQQFAARRIVQTPQGMFYLLDPTTTEPPVPMEYLGYGFRDAAYFDSPSASAHGFQTPQFHDRRAPSWHYSQSPSASATRQVSRAPSTTTSRTPSPLRRNSSWHEGLRSAPLPQETWSRSLASPTSLPRTDLGPPPVLNGSNRMSRSTTLGDDLHTGRPRRVSDSIGFVQQRADPWRINGTPVSRGLFYHQDTMPTGRSDESGFVRQYETETADVIGSDISVASNGRPSPGSLSVPLHDPIPPSGTEDDDEDESDDKTVFETALEQPLSREKTPSPTPWQVSQNGTRKSATVPPLDLTASLAEHFQENGPIAASKALSPVQETRTPSPMSARISAESREGLFIKGSNGRHIGSPGFNNLPHPPLPLRVPVREAYRETPTETQNGHVELPSLSPISTNFNPWQQATKKGGKKGKSPAQPESSKSKSREPMPADVSQRKGG